MDTRRRHLSLILALSMFLAGLWLVAALWSHGWSVAYAASNRHVAVTGTDTGACTNSGSPCRTVQYAVDKSQDGDTIKVATGVYTGVLGRPAPPGYVGPAVVTQVVYVSKTVTIRGGYKTGSWNTSNPTSNPTTLDARRQGRVLFIAGNINPTIEGLRLTRGDALDLGGDADAFDAGGGIFVITATATITNNQVYTNTAWVGGGLYVYNSPSIVSNNSIYSNTASQDVGGGGGGVSLESSQATVSKNTFTSNSARWGGGLYTEHSTRVQVRNNTFSANFALRTGGAIDLETGSSADIASNTILSNTAEERGGGGICIADSGDTVIMNNTVSLNTVAITDSDQGGGGIILLSSPNVTLTGNTIDRNFARAGGGIQVEGSENVTIDSNTVTTNTASNDGGGGGVSLESSRATVSKNTFTSNSARWGGGLYTEHSTGVQVHSNSFSANFALRTGGAIDVDAGSSADIASNTILSNTAEERGGGGICIAGSGDTVIMNNAVSLNTVTITDSGQGGGGIILLSSPNVTLTGNTIDRNFAGSGGGIQVEGSEDVTIDGNTVTTNTATFGGGAYLVESAATLSSNRFISNTVSGSGGGVVFDTSTATLTGNTLSANTATEGGGGAFVYKGAVTLTGNDFTGNRAKSSGGLALYQTTATLSGGTVSDNQANEWGGGVNIGSSTADLSSVTVMNNTAASGGGGVNVDVSAVTMSGAQVVQNAAGQGGGIQVSNSGVLTVTDSSILSNTATVRGGGLYGYLASVTVDGCSILSNTASSGGGGLDLDESAITITSSSIVSNTDTAGPDEGGGGGIWLGSGSTAVITDGVIAYNRSGDSGGGVHVNSSTAKVMDSNVHHNRAGTSGGGIIAVGDSNLTIKRTFIENNTSEGGGGGAWTGDNTPLELENAVVAGNQSGDRGSGVELRRSGMVMNVTVADNQATGSDPRAFVADFGGEAGRFLTVTNSIIWGNGTLDFDVVNPGSSTYTVTYSDIGNGFIEGPGNISQDPRFRNAANQDYHLVFGSPAIDTGTSEGAPDLDVEGSLRPMDGNGDGTAEWDMGAYESPTSTLGLDLSKEVWPDPVQPGGMLTYTVHLTNTSNVDLTATVTDTLPAPVSPTGDLIFPVSLAGPGGVWTRQFTVTAEWGYQGPLTNTVEVTTEGGPTAAYTITSQAVAVPGLVVTKEAYPSSVLLGGTVTFTIRVTNTGSMDLSATITDTLPDHVTYSGDTTWTTLLSGPGDTWMQELVATVASDYVGPLTNLVQVTTVEGATGEQSQEITVVDVPVAGLHAINDSPTLLGNPTTMTATVAAGTHVTYAWSLGDGSTASDAVGVYTFPAAGVYAAVVTASNPVSLLSATTAISIYQASQVNPGEETTLAYTGTQGLTTTVQVPADAVSETVSLAYTPVDTATGPPPNFAFAGNAFELDAYQNDVLQSGFVFSAAVTIEIHYTDADVAGLDEDSLILDYWTGSDWMDARMTCDPPSDYDRHPDENWLSVPVCHLSQFALFGQEVSTAQKRIYLPIIRKQ